MWWATCTAVTHTRTCFQARAATKAVPSRLSVALDDLVLTAEFTPYQDVAVMAKVAGFVKQIRVDIGDHAQRGELLATLEVSELQDELAKAQAELAAARANILTAQAAAGIAHLSFARIPDVLQKIRDSCRDKTST